MTDFFSVISLITGHMRLGTELGFLILELAYGLLALMNSNQHYSFF